MGQLAGVVEWLGNGNPRPLAPLAQMAGFPLPPSEQVLRAALHGPRPWPIRLHRVSAPIDGGVAACAVAKHLQAQSAAEAVKAVAEVEGAGQVAEDHRIKVVGNQ